MKFKKTNLLFIVALIVIMPLFAIQTNAITYPVDIAQNPIKVYAGETVIVTVTIGNMIRDEEITSARLSHIFKGDISPQPSIVCEETIPQRENVITFVFGSFAEGDVISYKIYLEFQGADNHQSEWYSFTVGGSRPILTNMQIMYICIAAAVVIIITVSVIVLRKRR